MNMKEACEFIRTEIQELIEGNRDRGRRNLGDRKSIGEGKVQTKYFRDKSYSRKIIRSLEKDYDSYDKIAGKFKDKMIVLLWKLCSMAWTVDNHIIFYSLFI